MRRVACSGSIDGIIIVWDLDIIENSRVVYTTFNSITSILVVD